MKLPVHTKLRKHIGRTALRTGCNLIIHIIVFEPYSVIIIMCLCKHRKIIVRDLCDRVGSLFDTMSDLMGDSPAKILTALIPAAIIRLYRNSVYHSRRRPPLDTYMVA